MIRTALVSILALVGPAPLATAETITVCASGCDYTSINAAIAAASDGDVIQLAAETYYEGEVIDTLGKAITLRGVLDPWGQPVSIIDGKESHRVLQCITDESHTTTLEFLSIRNGLGELEAVLESEYEVAGGLFLDSGSPVVRGCHFAYNYSSGSGAGVLARKSSAVFSDCFFQRNRASGVGAPLGGAVCIRNSPLSFSGCRFEGNSAITGGAIALYNYSSETSGPCCTDSDLAEVSIQSCLFEGNFATYAGACCFWGGKIDLVGCEFRNNFSGEWGGCLALIPLETADLGRISKCSFSENQSGIGVGESVMFIQQHHDDPLIIFEKCSFAECCQAYPPWIFDDGGGNNFEPWCDDCRENVDCLRGDVAGSDLFRVLSYWGTHDAQCDIDGDGTVTASDLGLLFAAWGPCQ